MPPDMRDQLYAEQQQHQDRKRKRQNSGSSPPGHTPMIINNYIPSYPNQGGSLDLGESSTSRSCSPSIPGLRDEAVKADSK